MTGSGYRPTGPGPEHPPARPPNMASGGMDPSHLRAEVARLRRREAELLEANGREVERRRRAEAALAPYTPHYVFDPAGWEATYDWAGRGELVEYLDLRPGDVRQVATLVQGPRKWVAAVVVSRSDDGDPEEVEDRWFDSEEEARAAAEGETP